MNPTIAPAVEVPTKDYRAPLRFWHWANALLISLQLITILFQKVIVNSRSAVPEFQQALSKDHVTITQQQGRGFCPHHQRAYLGLAHLLWLGAGGAVGAAAGLAADGAVGAALLGAADGDFAPLPPRPARR